MLQFLIGLLSRRKCQLRASSRSFSLKDLTLFASMPKTSFKSFRLRSLSSDENSITKSSRCFDISDILSFLPLQISSWLRQVNLLYSRINNRQNHNHTQNLHPSIAFSYLRFTTYNKDAGTYKTFVFFLFQRASLSFSYSLSCFLTPFWQVN